VLQLQVNGTTPSVTLAANGSIGVGSTPGYGTNGQVLTSSGTGSAPTWAAVSSGVTLVTSTTATAASSVIFTGLSTAYGVYLLEYDSVFGNSPGDGLALTISADNGATYYASSYATQGTYTIAGTTTTRSTTNEPVFYLGPFNGSGNSLSQPSSGSIWMYAPAGSKRFTAQNLASCPNNAGNIENLIFSFGGPNGTSPINAVKIVFAGGATITGNFRLYGYAA
jgi:hypothetical protein